MNDDQQRAFEELIGNGKNEFKTVYDSQEYTWNAACSYMREQHNIGAITVEDSDDK